MLKTMAIMGSDDGVNALWPLPDEPTIDGFQSLFAYHETTEELKYKLLYANLELESLRSSAKEEMTRKQEEMQRKDEIINQLIKERDGARDQLQTLLNRIAAVPMIHHDSTAVPMIHHDSTAVPMIHHDSPPFMAARGSSSITESDSLSETLNNHTSPVDSFFDLSSMNTANPFFNAGVSSGIEDQDPDSMIIECLAMRRGLPERGKLLEAVQAVTRATPLLETLLTTGPLPQWRNPPPLQMLPMPPAMADPLSAGGGVVSPSVLVQRGVFNGSPRAIGDPRPSKIRKISR